MSIPIEDVVAWIGTIAGILLNISPMILIFKIMKGQENYKIMPEAMLILNFLCGELWFCYWFRQKQFVPTISASFGIFFGSLTAIIYLYYFLDRHKIKWLIGIFIVIDFVAQIYYICMYIFKSYSTTGNIATILTIFNYIAPGQNIMKVIREKNSKYIPIASVLSGAFCSGSWFIFGLLIWDIPTIICNGISLVFALINTVIWTIFYLIGRKGNVEKDEKEVELNEKDEEEETQT